MSANWTEPEQKDPTEEQRFLRPTDAVFLINVLSVFLTRYLSEDDTIHPLWLLAERKAAALLL